MKKQAISEDIFKIVLDKLWDMYNLSRNIDEKLKDIGLEITNETTGDGAFNDLHNMQDEMMLAVFEILGIDEDMESFRKGEGLTLLDDLCDYFVDVHNLYPKSTVFPEPCYDRFIDVVTLSGDIKLPWQ